MNLYKTGWLAIAIEIIVLLIWLYDVYGSKKWHRYGRKRIGNGLSVWLSAYTLIGIILMLVNNKYCTITVIVMAAIPLLLVIYGLIRYYRA